MNIFKGKLPDITPAQIIAALTWVGAQAVASGWIDNNREQRYVAIGSTIITSVWIAGDAILRGFRNIAKSVHEKDGTLPPPSA